MTAAVLIRPAADEEEDDARWFELEPRMPAIEQLLLDRNTGVAAAREHAAAPAQIDAHNAADAASAWDAWFEEALADESEAVMPSSAELGVSEPLHIAEFRLASSRSYLGGGSAMRPRRTRR